MIVSPEKVAAKAIIFITRLSSFLVGFTNDTVFDADVLFSNYKITHCFEVLIICAKVIRIFH
jgi:hypothetical protein